MDPWIIVVAFLYHPTHRHKHELYAVNKKFQEWVTQLYRKQFVCDWRYLPLDERTKVFKITQYYCGEELPPQITYVEATAFNNHAWPAWPTALKHLNLNINMNMNADNQPPLHNLPSSLEILELKDFNQPITLPEELVRFNMSFNFNQPIVFPPHLKYLMLGPNFKQAVDYWPPQLEVLTIIQNLPCGKIHGLPSSLFGLSLGYNFDQPIVLPPNLKYLYMTLNGGIFNQPLHLPDSLTSLRCSKCFNQPLVLPSGLSTLIFGNDFNQKLELPSSLVKLRLGHCWNQSFGSLPHSLRSLELGDQFNQPISLPPNLSLLRFGRMFNQTLLLPLTLSYLTFGRRFNQPISLPPHLTVLEFGDDFNQPLDLPKHLVALGLGKGFRQCLHDFLPPALHTLMFYNANLFDFPPRQRQWLLRQNGNLIVFYKQKLDRLRMHFKKRRTRKRHSSRVLRPCKKRKITPR